MKKFFHWSVWVLAGMGVTGFVGCSTIKGNTLEDKRQYVRDMRDGTLQDLYRLKPEAEAQIKNAAGYAVFSNINTHLMFIGTANGYGVLKNQSTGKETFLKMFGLGGGLGLGIKDFRAVIIFRKAEDLTRFLESGWDFYGQVDAVAQSADKGGSISGAQSVDLDIITYQLTESGLALQLTFQGAKIWAYDELNG